MSDIDPYHEEDFELVLGNKQLFFLAVVVFAVFFSLGYMVGYNRGEAAREPVMAANRPPEIAPPPIVRPSPPASPSDAGDSAADKQPAGESATEETAPVPRQPLRASMEGPDSSKPAPSQASAQGTAPPPVRTTSPPAATPAVTSPASAPSRPPAPPVRAAATVPAAENLPKGAYLQVLARRERAPAEQFAAGMRGRNYPVVIDDQGGDGWFRVVIGPLNEEEIQSYQQRMSADGIQSFVRKK